MTSLYKVTLGLATCLMALAAHAEGSAVESSNIAISAAVPQSQVDKKIGLELTTTLLGSSLEDQIENSKWAGGELDIVGHRKFTSYLSTRIDLTVLMSTGTYTNQYTDAGKAPNAIFLNEAVLQLDPLKFFTFEAGVIQTDFLSLPSNFQPLGFPSLRETIHIQGDVLKLSTFAMQSIPTSDSKAVQPTENGLITTLNTFGLSLGTPTEDKDDPGLAVGVTRFSFNNLNASAAQDSQYLGNTMVSPGPQPRFAYDFAGTEFGAQGKMKLTKNWSGSLNGAYLKNDLAPDGSNVGYTYSGGLTVAIAGLEYGIVLGHFYNETDTLPASYASLSRGYNDRLGNKAVLTIEDKKQKIVGKIQYVESTPIIDMPYITDRSTLLFSLESAYEIL